MQLQTKYYVKHEGNSAEMRVVGRASYLNCMGIGEFFDRMLDDGVNSINVDCSECTGMDSTFLGIIAGAALRLVKTIPKGEMTLIGLSPRNKELVENLGLDNFVSIKEVQARSESSESGEAISQGGAKPEDVLRAHENLVETDPSNREKFEDVIKFLKREIETSKK